MIIMIIIVVFIIITTITNILLTYYYYYCQHHNRHHKQWRNAHTSFRENRLLVLKVQSGGSDTLCSHKPKFLP